MSKVKIIFIFSGKKIKGQHRTMTSSLRTILIALVLLIICLPAAFAQAPSQIPAEAEGSGDIEDNSFLLEEAYNQEPGVIQHISFFNRLSESRDWAYSFTEEIPVTGQKHQFSLTMTGAHAGDFRGSGAGLGDTAINYRYQLVGTGGARLAISPRLSLLLPTGDSRVGRGSGGTGIQTNLPVSVKFNKHLVTHWNAGATWVPRSKNELGERAGTVGVNLGQSFIWLARQNFNVMLETAFNDYEAVVAPGKTQRGRDLLMSPGVRWAHNFKSGLQIVPGVAFPMGVGPSSGEKGVILYLSFEHPFGPLMRRQAK